MHLFSKTSYCIYYVIYFLLGGVSKLFTCHSGMQPTLNLAFVPSSFKSVLRGAKPALMTSFFPSFVVLVLLQT